MRTTTPDVVAPALEDAADRGRLAPSVHNTQPWTFVLFPDRVEIRADRSRQLAVLDPAGRELVQSVGAALFNVRAALAARGLATVVERLPRPGDPDLLAVVRPVNGAPDPVLARLARAIPRRHTNRRPFTPMTVPDEIIDRLTEATAAEATLLVAVRSPEQLALVAGLTQQADRLQSADPAYREELRQVDQPHTGAGRRGHGRLCATNHRRPHRRGPAPRLRHSRDRWPAGPDRFRHGSDARPARHSAG